MENKTKKPPLRLEKNKELPHFSYKSSIIIFLTMLISITLLPMIFDRFTESVNLLTVIVGGLISGFVVAYAQYKIDKTIQQMKYFWLIGLLCSVLCGAIIFLLLYSNILL